MKTGRFTTLLATLAMAAAITPALADLYSDAVLADSPVAYWRLGEASGSTAYDSSGNSRDATYYGPTLGQTGALLTSSDTAVLFNASEGDKIQYGSDLYPGAGSWTAEAWVRGSSYAAQQSLVSYYAGGYSVGHNSYYFLSLTSAGYPYWGVRDTGGNWADITGSTSLTDDQWHHVVGVLDQGNDQMRLYVDGSLAGSASASSIGSIADSGYPVNIGWTYRYWTSDYIYLNGRLDEVALYGSALSAEQVLAHYNASVPEASTLALFGLGLAALAVVRGRRRRAGRSEG